MANNVGSCCVRFHVVKSLTGFKLFTTTPNKKEQHATECANGPNMQNPTMLELLANYVASVCTGLQIVTFPKSIDREGLGRRRMRTRKVI